MPFFSQRFSPRVIWSFFLAAVLVALLLLWNFDPATAGFFPPCIFHKVTDLYCPGCGATRACDALVEGKINQAFGYNPLFIVCFPFALFFLARSVWLGVLKNEQLEVPQRLSKYLLALAIVTIAFGVLRNLPFGELAWMRP